MRKITTIAAIAIVAMSSCTKDNSSTTSQSEIIEFVSESITTRVNSTGDEWTKGDQIGVYMMDLESLTPYTNYQYEALTGGESTTFVPVDSDVALEFGLGEMSFYAYYPYNSTTLTTAAGTGIEIDCSNQSKADFMWAENLSAYRGDVISLPFEHKMSRLELVITPLENISWPWLGGLEASIVGVVTKGECSNIENGEVFGKSGDDVELTFATEEYVVDSQSDSGYSLAVNAYAEMVTANVIFFPQTLTSAATVTVVVGSRSFSINIPSGTEFLSGKLHRYNVTVGYDYVEFAGGSTISDWNYLYDYHDPVVGEYEEPSVD